MYLEKINRLDWQEYYELFDKTSSKEITQSYNYSSIELLIEFGWIRALTESNRKNVLINATEFIYLYNKHYNEIEINKIEVEDKTLKNLLGDLSYFRKLIYNYSCYSFSKKLSSIEKFKKEKLEYQIFEALSFVDILENQYSYFGDKIEKLIDKVRIKEVKN